MTAPADRPPPPDEPGSDPSRPPTGPDDEPRLPTRLSELSPRAWRRALVGALTGFQRDNCSDLAAALTYWTVLGLFPALVVVVSLVRLVATGPAAVDTIMDVVEPYLLQANFITRTSTGRKATDQAYRHLGLSPPPKAGADSKQPRLPLE